MLGVGVFRRTFLHRTRCILLIRYLKSCERLPHPLINQCCHSVLKSLFKLVLINTYMCYIISYVGGCLLSKILEYINVYKHCVQPRAFEFLITFFI